MYVRGFDKPVDKARREVERMPLFEKLRWLQDNKNYLAFYAECFKAGLITDQEARRLRFAYLPKIGNR